MGIRDKKPDAEKRLKTHFNVGSGGGLASVYISTPLGGVSGTCSLAEEACSLSRVQARAMFI